MKIEELKLCENALLALDLLRALVESQEKPDIDYDGSVEELVKLLDIAAHSCSRDIIQSAQQFLGFTDYSQIIFFKSVGVRLENIFSSRMLANAHEELERDVFGEDYNHARYKYYM